MARGNVFSEDMTLFYNKVLELVTERILGCPLASALAVWVFTLTGPGSSNGFPSRKVD